MILLKTIKEGTLDLRLNGFRFKRDFGEPPVQCEVTEEQFAQYRACFEDDVVVAPVVTKKIKETGDAK